jgi:hemin uptake protein HemP
MRQLQGHQTGSSPPEPPRSGQAEASPCQPANSPVCISSEVLFGTAQEIVIQHGVEVYRLRKTRLGKLLLTK